jgi:hypothetical protein
MNEMRIWVHEVLQRIDTYTLLSDLFATNTLKRAMQRGISKGHTFFSYSMKIVKIRGDNYRDKYYMGHEGTKMLGFYS